MSTITINGTTYQTSSNSSLIVNNNGVFINGERMDGSDEKVITISVQGDIETLETGSGTIAVTGNVSTCKSMSGNITITGDVSGDVKNMSGDIKAKSIKGNAKTMSGDIIKNG